MEFIYDVNRKVDKQRFENSLALSLPKFVEAYGSRLDKEELDNFNTAVTDVLHNIKSGNVDTRTIARELVFKDGIARGQDSEKSKKAYGLAVNFVNQVLDAMPEYVEATTTPAPAPAEQATEASTEQPVEEEAPKDAAAIIAEKLASRGKGKLDKVASWNFDYKQDSGSLAPTNTNVNAYIENYAKLGMNAESLKTLYQGVFDLVNQLGVEGVTDDSAETTNEYGKTVKARDHIANNLYLLSQNPALAGNEEFNQTRDGRFTIPGSLNEEDGTVILYDPRTRKLSKESITLHDELFGAYQYKNGLVQSEGEPQQIVGYGGQYMAGDEAAINELFDTLRASLAAPQGDPSMQDPTLIQDPTMQHGIDEEALASERGLTVEQYRELQKTIAEKGGLSGQDYTRLGAAAADLGAIAASFVPGYGTIASAVLGVGSTVANSIVDAQQGQFSLGNLAMNLGMDAVGLIPGVGTAGKLGKVAKGLGGTLKIAVALFAAQGMLNAKTAAEKLIKDPSSLNSDDIQALAQGFSALAGGTAMGARALKARKGLTGDVAVRTESGNVVSVPKNHPMFSTGKKSEIVAEFQRLPGMSGETPLINRSWTRPWRHQANPAAPIYDVGRIRDKGVAWTARRWGHTTDNVGKPASTNTSASTNTTSTSGTNNTAPASPATAGNTAPATTNTSAGNTANAAAPARKPRVVNRSPELTNARKVLAEALRYKRKAVKGDTDALDDLNDLKKNNAALASNPDKEIADIGARLSALRKGGKLGLLRLIKYQQGGKTTAFTGVGFGANANWYKNNFSHYKQNILDQLSATDDTRGNEINKMQTDHATLFNKANASGDWTKKAYADDAVRQYQEVYGGRAEGNNFDFNAAGISKAAEAGDFDLYGPKKRTSKDWGNHNYVADGLYSGITDYRRVMGRKEDWDENSEEFKNWQKDLGTKNYEMFLDSDNYYKLRRLQQPAPNDQANQTNPYNLGEGQLPDAKNKFQIKNPEELLHSFSEAARAAWLKGENNKRMEMANDFQPYQIQGPRIQRQTTDATNMMQTAHSQANATMSKADDGLYTDAALNEAVKRDASAQARGTIMQAENVNLQHIQQQRAMNEEYAKANEQSNVNTANHNTQLRYAAEEEKRNNRMKLYSSNVDIDNIQWMAQNQKLANEAAHKKGLEEGMRRLSTLSGNEALQQLVNTDPQYKSLNDEITRLTKEGKGADDPEVIDVLQRRKLRAQELEIQAKEKVKESYAKAYGLPYEATQTFTPSIAFKRGGSLEAAKMRARSKDTELFMKNVHKVIDSAREQEKMLGKTLLHKMTLRRR